MNNSTTGVLLINLGTPDSPQVPKVRSYLSQFLNDPRVIDIPFLLRLILVNLIIVPFRSNNSSKIYKKIWTPKGSPLLLNSIKMAEALQKELGDKYEVELAMRYKNPSLELVLKKMKLKNYKKIVILPLFPHYASSSTGSALERAMKIISKWWVIPELKIVSSYHDHKGFIKAIVEKANEHKISDYHHIIFSYHGLPDRHVDKVYQDSPCSDKNCEALFNEENKYCYKAQCYDTTRLVAQELGIKEADYTVSFQSRLDKKWLSPFSDKVIEQLAKEGKKKLLVFSPAFTADCLETLFEIGEEYDEIFKEHGGEKVQLVESLNDNSTWISALKDLVVSSN